MPSKAIVKCPAEESLSKLLECLSARVDERVIYRERVTDLSDESGFSLKAKGSVYHRQCFQQVTNKNTLERFNIRQEKRANEASSPPDLARPTRSAALAYDKNKCFFCQTDTDDKLYNLRTFNRSNLIKAAINKSQNDDLRVRFNSFSDAHAGDVKYHCKCMVSNVDKVLSQNNEVERDDANTVSRYAVDEELVNIISDGIAAGSIYQMNDICNSYLRMLQENSITEIRSEKYIKQYLKKLLSEEVEDIVFETSSQRNMSAMVYSAKFSSAILDNAIGEILSDGRKNMKDIAKAARVIRCAALESTRNAEKTFNTSERIHENEIPVELFNLIKWILGGFNSLAYTRNCSVSTIAKGICNTILYNIKSDRQASHKKENAGFRHTYENSQVVNLAIAVRQHSRSQRLVDMLHSMGECISTKRCLRIETAIANEIIRQTENRGYYLPSNTKASRIVQFHLDNTNWIV